MLEMWPMTFEESRENNFGELGNSAECAALVHEVAGYCIKVSPLKKSPPYPRGFIRLASAHCQPLRPKSSILTCFIRKVSGLDFWPRQLCSLHPSHQKKEAIILEMDKNEILLRRGIC